MQSKRWEINFTTTLSDPGHCAILVIKSSGNITFIRTGGLGIGAAILLEFSWIVPVYRYTAVFLKGQVFRFQHTMCTEDHAILLRNLREAQSTISNEIKLRQQPAANMATYPTAPELCGTSRIQQYDIHTACVPRSKTTTRLGGMLRSEHFVQCVGGEFGRYYWHGHLCLSKHWRLRITLAYVSVVFPRYNNL